MKKSIGFLKYALKMVLVKGEWFDLYEEFKELHVYYTTREQNPLKKMQSLIAIACKLLRIIFTILKKGIKYDPQKMLKDIRRKSRQESLAA